MKILILSSVDFYPTNNGSKRRIRAVTEYLAKFNEVVFTSLKEKTKNRIEQNNEKNEGGWKEIIIEKDLSQRFLPALKSLYTKNSYAQIKYWNNDLYIRLESIVLKEKFDWIWINFLPMTQYIEKFIQGNYQHFKIKKINKKPLFILDQHNLDESYFKSFLHTNTSFVNKAFAYLEMKKARYYQKKWFPFYDTILSVSEEDQNGTRKYVEDKKKVILAPNGVDTAYFNVNIISKNQRQHPLLVFGGSLDVTMNIDGVCWFVKDVFPMVLKQYPNAEFWIVGRNPPKQIIQFTKKRNIKVTGSVADVRLFYREASVFIIPLRIGGGTKIKTLEAMAMGLPIVSTSVGVQGIEVENHTHLLIADSEKEFAKSICEQIDNEKKGKYLGHNARKLIEAKYSWDSILQRVECDIMNHESKNFKI